jgi:hypothetical protein
MLSQDGAAERFDLTERDGSHPGSFESEAKPADTGEEIEDIQFIFRCGLFCTVRLSSGVWRSDLEFASTGHFLARREA